MYEHKQRRWLERTKWGDVADTVRRWRAGESVRWSHALKRYDNAPDAERRGMRALDVGCGAGHGVLMLLDKGYAQVDAVDKWEGVSPVFAGNPRIQFFCMDFDGFAAKPGRYDLITCCDAIEHLPHPRATLKKFRRWLKDDGRVLMTIPFEGKSTPNPFHLHAWTYREAQALVSEHFQIAENLDTPLHNSLWVILQK